MLTYQRYVSSVQEVRRAPRVVAPDVLPEGLATLSAVWVVCTVAAARHWTCLNPAPKKESDGLSETLLGDSVI